jgi:hypothetical protein
MVIFQKSCICTIYYGLYINNRHSILGNVHEECGLTYYEVVLSRHRYVSLFISSVKDNDSETNGRETAIARPSSPVRVPGIEPNKGFGLLRPRYNRVLEW